MKAWDYIEKRDVEVGKRRFLAEGYEVRTGHTCDDSCEGRGLEECYEGWQRAFPTRPLAEAFARKNPGVWGATVVEQVFELGHEDGLGRWGSWENTGDREEIEADLPEFREDEEPKPGSPEWPRV